MGLTNPRFKGQPTLEVCALGIHRMYSGELDADAVRRVQLALLDLGYQLPQFGADGHFGGEMGDAVTRFKTDRGIQPPDPVVGLKTMEALDRDARGRRRRRASAWASRVMRAWASGRSCMRGVSTSMATRRSSSGSLARRRRPSRPPRDGAARCSGRSALARRRSGSGAAGRPRCGSRRRRSPSPGVPAARGLSHRAVPGCREAA